MPSLRDDFCCSGQHLHPTCAGVDAGGGRYALLFPLRQARFSGKLACVTVKLLCLPSGHRYTAVCGRGWSRSYEERSVYDITVSAPDQRLNGSVYQAHCVEFRGVYTVATGSLTQCAVPYCTGVSVLPSTPRYTAPPRRLQ